MIEYILVFNTSICYRYRESKSILVFKTFQHRSIDVPCDITATKYSGNKQHDERANKTSFRYLKNRGRNIDSPSSWRWSYVEYVFFSFTPVLLNHSMCDVRVFFDIYFTEFGTALTTILPILFQYCYKYCYSDSHNLWAVMKAGGLAL
jgi:hypothetical protein